MSSALHFTRTRIAPTPSGFLHLGNVLSFALTAAIARKTGAAILLRIDDLDQPRVQPEYVLDIFDTLRFMEIPWDEGPADYSEYQKQYSQMHRMDSYRQALQKLRETGQVFACNCSRSMIAKNSPDGTYPGTCRNKNLSLDAAGVCWRLNTSTKRELVVNAYQSTPITTHLPDTMQDFIVRKKDGFPAYQLASLLDDRDFGVDLVVRGEDLWTSTLAQLYLAAVLNETGFCNSTFYHHPLLLETGDRKLSKSAGSTSIQFLRNQGKKPVEIYSMIAGIMGYTIPVSNWQMLTEAMKIPGIR